MHINKIKSWRMCKGPNCNLMSFAVPKVDRPHLQPGNCEIEI